MTPESLTSENISHIAAEFWSTMASVTLSSVATLAVCCNEHEGIMGSIEIRGAWTGEIEIRASRTLAAYTASRLLEKPLEEVTIEECFDAIQESTNIVAGGIKRLLPPICKMAIPSMSGCSSLHPKDLNAAAIRTLFTSDAGEFSVNVVPS